jgi:hypothetical protein
MWNRIFVAATVISAVTLMGVSVSTQAQQSQDPKTEQKDPQRPQRQGGPAKPRPAEAPKPAEKPKSEPQGRGRGQGQPQGQSQGQARGQAPQQARPQAQPQGRARGQGPQRLPQQEQDRRVGEQQQRLQQYDTRLDQQRRAAEQRGMQLQQQQRGHQYGFERQYLDRLAEQQARLRLLRTWYYGNDPFFYTPPIYRYSRGGHFYEINEYGANVLRQAVNFGYEEGYAAGVADRQDHWAFGYEDSWAYQDGNYGYDGLYVDPDEYNYYFREGFRRGYEDGYYGRFRYGAHVSGHYTVLGGVMSIILGFQAIR